MSPDEPTTDTRRVPRRWIILTIVAVASAMVALSVVRDLESPRERVEAEHSISLPDSARQIQALGDASGSLMAVVGLDRGASSLMVIDRSDVPALLASFGIDPNARRDGEAFLCCGGAFGPAPSNSVYQPRDMPWPEELTPEARYLTEEPPGSADLARVDLYRLADDESVGVWLYSDWN